MLQSLTKHSASTDRHESDELLLQILKQARRERRGAAATKRLVRCVWGASFDLLSGLLHESRILGEQFVGSEYDRARTSNDTVFYVLMHLHANACLIASEVVSLLELGHAGGAIARWRTLYEVNIYAAFILKHGAKTAERYIRHMHVKDSEDLPSVDAALKAAGAEGFSSAEREALAELNSQLLKRYGEDFHGGFGWAKGACGKKGRLVFSDIASDVGLGVHEMFYRAASHLVHPTWKGILDNPGLPPDPSGEPLLAGPSDHGLWLPAELTTQSIYGATVSFLSCGPAGGRMKEIDRLANCVRLISDRLREVRDRSTAPGS